MSVHTYGLNDWLSYLWALHPSRIDLGLDRILEVGQRLECLKPAPFVITVAGTNGKGSTVALLAALLKTAGVSVGTYTSPHLQVYNERVCIDGQPVSDTMLCDAFLRIEKQRNDISLTYFEFGTLAALLCFQQQALDVVILEVGLGGRLDAVNCVDSDIAIVVSVGLDHQERLGHDLETIGQEKAGIFRKDCPAIYGGVPLSSIAHTAQRVGALLYQRDSAFDLVVDEATSTWSFTGSDSNQQSIRFEQLPLPHLPVENAACVLQALLLSPWSVTQAMLQSLTQVHVPGRFQQLSIANAQGQQIPVILDIAHNPHAAQYFAERLAQHGVDKARMVFAMRSEKDAQGVIEALSPQVEQWFLGSVEEDDMPFYSTDSLRDIITALPAKVTESTTLAIALQQAVLSSQAGDTITVSGSCRTVAGVLKFLKQEVYSAAN